MFRLLVVALAMFAGPAWAGCYNFVDAAKYQGKALPRAEICLGGVCEETTKDFECGNIHGAQYGYANGLRIVLDDNANLAFKNKIPVDYGQITCKAIDEGACFPS